MGVKFNPFTSKLDVVDSPSGDFTNIELALGTQAAPSISFTGDPNTGIYSPGADQLAISTNGSERACIDSSGRLLVGTSIARSNFFNTTTSPGIQIEADTANNSGRMLSIVHNEAAPSGPYLVFGHSRGDSVGSNTLLAADDQTGSISFQGSDGTQFVDTARIQSFVDGTPGANDMPGRLVFSTTPATSATPAEVMRITSDKYVRLASGTGGIQFNGDTAAANALDDYEEGTFTPTIIGTTTAGTGTYTSQSGRYTKIGRICQVQIRLLWTAHTGTGNLKITGLPFTGISLPSGSEAVISMSHSNLALPANETLQGVQPQNTADIGLTTVPVGGGAAASLAIDTAADLSVSLVYTVA